MMPGENQSRIVGIASEATAGICRNCTVLHQSLGEYVEALLTLKQKISDTDHLLSEYQEKCDELLTSQRESSKLHQQLDELLLKMVPLENLNTECEAMRSELENNKKSLRFFQQQSEELGRLKEENAKTRNQKRKLEDHLKTIEASSEKQTLENAGLKTEIKALESNLQKTQNSLKISQQMADEAESLKKENTNALIIKNTLESQLKQCEDLNVKQNQDITDLKKVNKQLEKQLKKTQENLQKLEKENSKEKRNTSTQTNSPERKVNKAKVRQLLKELWECVHPQSSQTGNFLPFSEDSNQCTFTLTEEVINCPTPYVMNSSPERQTVQPPGISHTEYLRSPLSTSRPSLKCSSESSQTLVSPNNMDSNKIINNTTRKTEKSEDTSSQHNLNREGNTPVLQEQINESTSVEIHVNGNTKVEEILDLFKPLPQALSPVRCFPSPWGTVKSDLSMSDDEEEEVHSHEENASNMLSCFSHPKDVHVTGLLSADLEHSPEKNTAQAFMEWESDEAESVLCKNSDQTTTAHFKEKTENLDQEVNTDYLHKNVRSEKEGMQLELSACTMQSSDNLAMTLDSEQGFDVQKGPLNHGETKVHHCVDIGIFKTLFSQTKSMEVTAVIPEVTEVIPEVKTVDTENTSCKELRNNTERCRSPPLKRLFASDIHKFQGSVDMDQSSLTSEADVSASMKEMFKFQSSLPILTKKQASVTADSKHCPNDVLNEEGKVLTEEHFKMSIVAKASGTNAFPMVCSKTQLDKPQGKVQSHCISDATSITSRFLPELSNCIFTETDQKTQKLKSNNFVAMQKQMSPKLQNCKTEESFLTEKQNVAESSKTKLIDDNSEYMKSKIPEFKIKQSCLGISSEDDLTLGEPEFLGLQQKVRTIHPRPDNQNSVNHSSNCIEDSAVLHGSPEKIEGANIEFQNITNSPFINELDVKSCNVELKLSNIETKTINCSQTAQVLNPKHLKAPLGNDPMVQEGPIKGINILVDDSLQLQELAEVSIPPVSHECSTVPTPEFQEAVANLDKNIQNNDLSCKEEQMHKSIVCTDYSETVKDLTRSMHQQQVNSCHVMVEKLESTVEGKNVTLKNVSMHVTSRALAMNQSPETIGKVRSEMGPPLPPLLLPLTVTPPRFGRLGPSVQIAGKLSFLSPVDDTSCQETPMHSLVLASPDNSKVSPPSLTTPSPSKEVPSSPLQFGSATPKHAVPVPGRLPSSALNSSSSSPSISQENSMRILDTMYPELSARARTINILRGNVNLNRSAIENITAAPSSINQISGCKTINSSSTAFTKTEQRVKRTSVNMLLPKSAKRLKLDNSSQSPANISQPLKNPTNLDSTGMEELQSESILTYGRNEDVGKQATTEASTMKYAVSQAIVKIQTCCFDLLPVIKSHLFIGKISKVPVLRDEEKEVIAEFCTENLSFAEDLMSAISNKIKNEKRLLSGEHLQALCRVYTAMCRQNRDWERAHILAYSILKEDFPESAKLILFMVATWHNIFSLPSAVCKVIQTVTKHKAQGDVLNCLTFYLGWAKRPPCDVHEMITSTLTAIQLGVDMKFQQHARHGNDLSPVAWQYIFILDLLCTHNKWKWTHDHLISKQLWPIMNTWVTQPRSQQTPIQDVSVAAILRLIGCLGQLGIKEKLYSSVKNVAKIINTFGRHGKSEGVPWDVQLAAIYAIYDLSPCNPKEALKALAGWRGETTEPVPPAVISCITRVASVCRQVKS